MLPNVVNNDDFELARSAKRELMHLRSRGTTPTADDVMLIARKAGLAEFLQYPSKAKVDIVRADARLAICSLADSIARNARTIREDRHDTFGSRCCSEARVYAQCPAD